MSGTTRTRRRRRETSTHKRGLSKAQIVAAVLSAAVVAVVAAIAVINRNAIPQSASQAPLYAKLRVGETAPPFSVTTIDGTPFDLQHVDGPVMLELFATWCPHCQRETAAIDALHERFGDGLSIVAVTGSDIAADRQSAESLDDVKYFAARFDVTYPIAYDANLDTAKSYLQGAFPTIVFIGADKHVRAVRSGERSLGQLTADARAAGAKES
ncbi:MAG TPA: TlpA disulfide reductase family protein [Verrucomicrobiae bacterium]|nr:TlpA disulfide reductase family protein [Verrucomicrobiae bacterium]